MFSCTDFFILVDLWTYGFVDHDGRAEDGRRQKDVSIFAARMFEQRVLQAYREKVAKERQRQLLHELDEEDKTTRDREMKKQTQN